MALGRSRGLRWSSSFLLLYAAVDVFNASSSIEAELLCCSTAPSSMLPSLLAPCGSCRKRALFRSTWIYVQEPEAAGDGNCWRCRLAVARGFWQGCKWTHWVTQSFPVSLHPSSLFLQLF